MVEYFEIKARFLRQIFIKHFDKVRKVKQESFIFYLNKISEIKGRITKMKISIALLTVMGTSAEMTAPANSVIARDGGDRRYAQLVDMMEHYNKKFDERKYWTYGCNCLMLGNTM